MTLFPYFQWQAPLALIFQAAKINHPPTPSATTMLISPAELATQSHLITLGAGLLVLFIFFSVLWNSRKQKPRS